MTGRLPPLALDDLGDHPVRGGDDREVLGQVDLELLGDGAERLPQLVDRLLPEPFLPALLDLHEQRRPDLRRDVAGRSGADDPVAPEPASASVSVPLRSRVRPDEDVAPPLHASERREDAVLREPGDDRKLTHA